MAAKQQGAAYEARLAGGEVRLRKTRDSAPRAARDGPWPRCVSIYTVLPSSLRSTTVDKLRYSVKWLYRASTWSVLMLELIPCGSVAPLPSTRPALISTSCARWVAGSAIATPLHACVLKPDARVDAVRLLDRG